MSTVTDVPRAILLDLDNTLTHRRRSIIQYISRFQHDFEAALAETDAQRIETIINAADQGGYGVKQDIFAHLRQHLPWREPPSLEMLASHWFTHFPTCAMPVEGLYDTLDALQAQRIRLGIVTNGTVRSQTAKIEVLALAPYMTTIVISEALGTKKPDPAIFAHALTEIGTAAQHTWFVGDHPVNDVLGAASCGLTSVWMQGSHTWPSGEHTQPARQIHRLPALLDLIAACQ